MFRLPRPAALTIVGVIIVGVVIVGVALLGASPASAQETPPAAPVTFALSGPDLARGATGIDVALLQLRLAQRGFWLSEELGRFGESTRHAVVTFQKFYGLKRTGRVDPYTRLAIGGFPDRATVSEAAGGHRIEIDLGRQVMIISTNDVVDGVFDISSGKSSTRSPRGSFALTREIRGIRRSPLGVLYSPKYFTGGYAIHGSNSVPATAASHGCIRLTNQTINYLWASGLIPIGTSIKLA